MCGGAVCGVTRATSLAGPAVRTRAPTAIDMSVPEKLRIDTVAPVEHKSEL